MSDISIKVVGAPELIITSDGDGGVTVKLACNNHPCDGLTLNFPRPSALRLEKQLHLARTGFALIG